MGEGDVVCPILTGVWECVTDHMVSDNIFPGTRQCQRVVEKAEGPCQS
jgi:hypothetical protein